MAPSSSDKKPADMRVTRPFERPYHTPDEAASAPWLEQRYIFGGGINKRKLNCHVDLQGQSRLSAAAEFKLKARMMRLAEDLRRGGPEAEASPRSKRRQWRR